MKTKFGVIGCQHAHIIEVMEDLLQAGYLCAGIYEAENHSLAEQVSQMFNAPIVADMAVLLADEEIEIIGCADINSKKIDIIEACEQHGKHIMADKPLAVNHQDVIRLENIIQRNQIQIGCLFTSRFNRSIIALKQMIDNEAMGKLLHLSIRKPHLLNPASRPAWHFDKTGNGGIVIDLLIHDFDLMRWFTNSELADMQGIATKNILPEYTDFYDLVSMNVVTESGVSAQLYSDWLTPEKSWGGGDFRIFATGTRGCAELRMAGDPYIEQSELMFQVTDSQSWHKVELPEVVDTATKDFLRRIRGEANQISHKDILAASQAAVKADRQVIRR